MLAFSNDEKIKDFYVKRMKKHYEADEIIQGIGWENGKGCFIGCTLHEYSHRGFELDACEYDRKRFKDVAASIEKTKEAIMLCIKFQRDGGSSESATESARLATESARSAARSAARSSARSSGSAAWLAYSASDSASDSAWLVAWLAAKSAESAADSARLAARSARSAARSAGSAAGSVAWSAAGLAVYEKYAKKLMQLLRGEV